MLSLCFSLDCVKHCHNDCKVKLVKMIPKDDEAICQTVSIKICRSVEKSFSLQYILNRIWLLWTPTKGLWFSNRSRKRYRAKKKNCWHFPQKVIFLSTDVITVHLGSLAGSSSSLLERTNQFQCYLDYQLHPSKQLLGVLSCPAFLKCCITKIFSLTENTYLDER